MDNRRRTLAQSGQQSAVPSSIPRPSTTLRQSMAPMGHAAAGAGRTSIAPSRMSRQSMAYPSASQDSLAGSQSSQMFSQGHGGPSAAPREAPGTVNRMSSMYTSVNNPMSVQRGGALRRDQVPTIDYAPPSERRTSTYRRSTMLGQQPTTPSGGPASHTLSRIKQDPREIRPLAVKQKYANDIVAFLNARNQPADQKQLLTPTGAQFQTIFKFLIGCLIPGFQFGGQGKKFEDEVVPALRTVLYPFADSITKSHLQAVGSQSSWPNMLAMLHWLVMVAEHRMSAFDGDAELHVPVPYDNTDEVHPDATQHAWLDFVRSSYPKFLASEDFDQAAELELFDRRIESGRQAKRERVVALQAEVDKLEEEWTQLEKTPDPLIKEQETLEKTQRDKVKFQEYHDSYSVKVDGHAKAIQASLQRKEEAVQERERGMREVERLTADVKKQGLTPTEIQHMTTEKQNLQAQLNSVHKKTDAVLTKSYGLEIELTKRLDRVTNLTTTYDAKAQSLSLLPTAPDGYEHINFAQELNSAAENPAPDCTTEIRPALLELRAKEKSQVSKTNGEIVVLEEQITRLNELIAELKEAYDSDLVILRQVEHENHDLHEAAHAEFETVNADLERLQSAVNTLSSTMNTNLIQAEWRFSQRSAERIAVIEETNEIRRVNREALTTKLEEIIAYRDDMMSKTEQLAAIAQSAVE